MLRDEKDKLTRAIMYYDFDSSTALLLGSGRIFAVLFKLASALALRAFQITKS